MSKPKKEISKRVIRKSTNKFKAEMLKVTPPTRMDRLFGPISEDNFQGRLELVHDIVITVALALEYENAEHGPDSARVLKVFAANELWAIILKMRGVEEE